MVLWFGCVRVLRVFHGGRGGAFLKAIRSSGTRGKGSLGADRSLKEGKVSMGMKNYLVGLVNGRGAHPAIKVENHGGWGGAVQKVRGSLSEKETWYYLDSKKLELGEKNRSVAMGKRGGKGKRHRSATRDTVQGRSASSKRGAGGNSRSLGKFRPEDRRLLDGCLSSKRCHD